MLEHKKTSPEGGCFYSHPSQIPSNEGSTGMLLNRALYSSSFITNPFVMSLNNKPRMFFSQVLVTLLKKRGVNLQDTKGRDTL